MQICVPRLFINIKHGFVGDARARSYQNIMYRGYFGSSEGLHFRIVQ